MPSQLSLFSMTPLGVTLYDVAGAPMVDASRTASVLLNMTPTAHGSIEARGGARTFRDCILDFGVTSLVQSIRSIYSGRLRGRNAEFIVFTADAPTFSGHVVIGRGFTAITPRTIGDDAVKNYGRPGAKAAYTVFNDTLYLVQQAAATLSYRPAYRNDVSWQAESGIPAALCISSHADRLWVGGVEGREDAVAFSAIGIANDFRYENGEAGILSISRRGGDSVTALSPSFYGDIYGFTEESISRINAPSVLDLRRETVSDTIGCVSHAGIVQVGNDLFFPSARGVHSLLTTQKYGDVETEFLSAPIQRLWNRIDPKDLESCSGAYDPATGLFMLAVQDRHLVFGGENATKVLVMHVQTRRWSVWDVEADCICMSGLQGWGRGPVAASGTKLRWLNCPDRFDSASETRGAPWSSINSGRRTYSPRFVTHWIDCGDPGVNKSFRRLDLLFRSGASYRGKVHWLIDDQYASAPNADGRARYSEEFYLNPRGDCVIGEGSSGGSTLTGPPYTFLGEMDDTPLAISIPLSGSGKRIKIEVEIPGGLVESEYVGGYPFELLGMNVQYLVEGNDWQTVGVTMPDETTETVFARPEPEETVTVGVDDGPQSS